MTASVEDLLKGMRSLLGAIDKAVVLASRTQVDAQQAQGRYQQAATGTAHPVLVRAVAAARTAAEKAGRTARLLAKSADAYTAYVNKIAPGAAGATRSVPGAMPDGEALTTPRTGGSLSRRLGQRIKETENSDDGLEHAAAIGNDVQSAFGAGTVVPTRPPAVAFTSPFQERVSAGDALLAALTLAFVGIRAAEKVDSFVRRFVRGKRERG